MPLQIRRGIEAERSLMTLPLAQGELLYVTDENRIYIGDGETLGGVPVIGYSDNAAKDAAAALFTEDTHTGISFTYAGGVISAVVDPFEIDLSTYEGSIKASDIQIGDAEITATGSVINLPAGSTVGGIAIESAGGEGETILGDFLNISIIGDDSSVIVDKATNTVTGSFIGDLTGNVTGSVFGDDSSIIVDSSNNTINGTVVGPVETTEFSVNYSGSNYSSANFNAIGGDEFRWVDFNVIGSDFDDPTSLSPSDPIGGYRIRVYGDSAIKTVFAIAAVVDSSVDFNSPNPSTNITIAVGNNTDLTPYNFTHDGHFSAPASLTPGIFPTIADRDIAIPTPVPGMMVYVADNGSQGGSPAVPKFQGYVGSPTNAWVDLN